MSDPNPTSPTSPWALPIDPTAPTDLTLPGDTAWTPTPPASQFLGLTPDPGAAVAPAPDQYVGPVTPSIPGPVPYAPAPAAPVSYPAAPAPYMAPAPYVPAPAPYAAPVPAPYPPAPYPAPEPGYQPDAGYADYRVYDPAAAPVPQPAYPPMAYPYQPAPYAVPGVLVPGQVVQTPYGPFMVGPKSKLAAGLLGIFLGGAGVGQFYRGNIGLGVAQLVVTLITFGMGALWGFIEGIMVLVAKPGAPLSLDSNNQLMA